MDRAASAAGPRLLHARGADRPARRGLRARTVPPRCSAGLFALPAGARPAGPRRERAAALVARATGDGEDGAVFGFLKRVQGGLPVIGLVSRLTAPENGFDGKKLGYSEYCRARYDRAGTDFGTACTELARNRKSTSRAILFVCWMVAQGAGIVADELILAASARVGVKSVDLEYEMYRFEEALDAAAKRRLRLKAPPELPSRAAASALLEAGVRACCRVPPDEALAGEDAVYMAALREAW